MAIDGATVVLDRAPNASGSYLEGTLVTLEAQPVSANDKVDWTGVLGKDGKLAAVDMMEETRVSVYLFVGTYMPIATPWLGQTPTPTPPPPGPATGSIESLQAQVLEVRFFESAPILVPGAARVYTQTFFQSATRYIYWELSLTHPGPEETLTFMINAVYYRADGSIFSQQTGSFSVLANAVGSDHVKGTGFAQTGNWSLGSYRVDLSVEGVLVASDSFQVTQ